MNFGKIEENKSKLMINRDLISKFKWYLNFNFLFLIFEGKKKLKKKKRNMKQFFRMKYW